jgi:hypothetical protein
MNARTARRPGCPIWARWALGLVITAGCAHRQPGRGVRSQEQANARCGEDAYLSSRGTCVPKAWYCSPALYDAGEQDGCDCDCGAPDPDCARKNVASWCYGAGMARPVAACALCGQAPGERSLKMLQ